MFHGVHCDLLSMSLTIILDKSLAAWSLGVVTDVAGVGDIIYRCTRTSNHRSIQQESEPNIISVYQAIN